MRRALQKLSLNGLLLSCQVDAAVQRGSLIPEPESCSGPHLGVCLREHVNSGTVYKEILLQRLRKRRD